MTTPPSPHQIQPDPGAAATRRGPRTSWSDGLGRAGSRSAQLLLIAAVIAGLVWLLSRVALVVIAASTAQA